MSRKTRSTLLLAAGVLLFLVALTADSLGIGTQPGIGAKQLIAAFVGIVVAAIGMAGLRKGGPA
jgi:hypothetical protein